MKIAIPLFHRFTALDAVGPYEVLSRLPGAEVVFVAHEPGILLSDNEMLGLRATASLDELPDPDILVVPGGTGTRTIVDDEPLLRWIRGAHEQSEWTTSVCTGAILLAAAGVLDGLRATTHWASQERLERYGVTFVSERVVRDGKIMTAAGVSAGIDMALVLAAEIAGERVAKAIQLSIEYDPQPPFDAGTPAKAGEDITNFVRMAAQRHAAATTA